MSRQTARRKMGDYDLPLHKSEGSNILVWVIALMFFLATLLLAANFTLSGLSKTWEQDLTGQLTIEIIPTSEKSKTALAVQAETVLRNLEGNSAIESARLLSEQNVLGLVEPWLGEISNPALLPLPILIDIQLAPETSINTGLLEKRLQQSVPNLRIDDHMGWLQEILDLLNVVMIASLIITGIVVATVLVTVAASARGRLSLLHDEIELLYLMGASDNYITGQMQRYIFQNTFKGALYGVGMALFFIAGLYVLSRADQLALLPTFSLPIPGWFVIAALPTVGGLLATIIARFTVMRTLTRIY